jgi:hypothetical protein
VAFGLPSRIGGRKRERVVNRFDIVCDDRRAPHHTTFSPKSVTLRFVRNLNHMDEILCARLPAQPGFSEETLAGRLSPFEATARYRTMIDQGLRLHRAFRNISNPALREAVIKFVIELEKSENVN